MAYNQRILDGYRAELQLRHTPPNAAPGQDGADQDESWREWTSRPFRSRTCPYCNGQRDATVKHTHPSTKPATAVDFWRHVLCEKYRAVQSVHAQRNLQHRVSAASSPSLDSAAPDDVSDYGDVKMFVVGPMVEQSEMAFRMLCREYGATLAFTPMLHARSYRDSALYRRRHHTSHTPDEVRAAVRDAATLVDRPCIVQFCGNDPDTVLAAARRAVGTAVSDTSERYYACDAVDLNLGCPQGIARRGHYGSFLMEDWERVHTMVHTLHVELEVPVTAKIRVFDRPTRVDGVTDYDEALTIAYANMLCDAGAQLLTVHGRTRAMKGPQTGLANLSLIRRLHTALRGRVAVLGNGNVRCYDDVVANLACTRCEGYMCAESLLYDPTLFAHPTCAVPGKRGDVANKTTRLCAVEHARAYLRWLRRCPASMGCVKAHLYKMCFHSYELHPTLRDALTRLPMHESTTDDNDVIVELCAATGDDGCTLDLSGAQSHNYDVSAASIDVCVEDDDDDGAEDASGESFTLLGAGQLAALEQHLDAVYAAEVCCDVDRPAPRPVRQLSEDVFAAEENYGIDF